MDTTNFKSTTVETDKPSRLPAGSTLEVAPGVHVPHPHAEVNLPGAGDPRSGDTKAVTEYTKTTVTKNEKNENVASFSVEQKPLSDEVKSKILTSTGAGTPVTETVAAEGAATTADETLVVDEPAAACEAK